MDEMLNTAAGWIVPTIVAVLVGALVETILGGVLDGVTSGGALSKTNGLARPVAPALKSLSAFLIRVIALIAGGLVFLVTL